MKKVRISACIFMKNISYPGSEYFFLLYIYTARESVMQYKIVL